MLKNIVSVCVLHSGHHIYILNARSIRKEHLNMFITERFIEKTVSVWDSGKKFRKSHMSCFVKKAVLKNFAIFTGKGLCWSLF